MPQPTQRKQTRASPSVPFADMVEIRRPPKKTFISQITYSRHILHSFLLTIIALCFVGYKILLKQEQAMTSQVSVAARSAKTLLVHQPHLVYGTAWKKDLTSKYVSEAVNAGFRFIDTACQPKHYNEPGVGVGWKGAADQLKLQRSDLWLQTKFTPFSGQDPNNCPYDPSDPIPVQIQTSLATSLHNLHTDYLDSWVMHSPYQTLEETMIAWRQMESAVDAGQVRQLGMSNCYSLEFFQAFYEEARHKPAVLQNRFYSDSDFDTELRQFCKEHGIQYQSFWTLGANRHALKHPEVHQEAERHNLTPETYMFAFLMSLGYVNPLSGTTSLLHMEQDVAVMERMQQGEVFFQDTTELRKFAKILGMPDL